MPHPTRRDALTTLGAALAAAALPTPAAAATPLVTRKIPKTGEALPAIGMGTWQTFNVGADPELRTARTAVLRTFFDLGGTVIDSSPMYGSAQPVVGHALAQTKKTPAVFAADKIWTSDGDETEEQFEETRAHWRVPHMDLMQVHNLVEWRAHLEHLRALKAAHRTRYIGVTTSHGRRHDLLAEVLRTQEIDAVQLTYNMTHRDAEKRLLPLARDRGIAVIANRPFDGGGLVDRLQRKGAPLPPFAAELGCHDWPSYLLKWIVSHPALTVAIPATSRVEHMRENMAACRGPLPDQKTRDRMLAHLQSVL